MSAKNDIQLKGTNLNNVECQDKDKVLHPETNAEQVLTTQNSDKSLEDWLTYNKVDPTIPLGGFSSYNGMIPWLEANYPNGSYTLPEATTSTLGGVIVGDNLTVSNGRVSVDRDSLSIPTIAEASYGANIIEDDYTTNGYGTIRIGNDTVISSDFGNSPISYNSSYKFPLRLDSKGRAGIEIDATMFPAQAQANWNQTDDTKPDYIKGRPNLSTVATSGSYNDLTNKPTIGAVYNGVLTLKYGNTTLGTFSANSDSNVTATIPTGLNYLIVESLPENPSTTTIYMLPKTDPATGDYYDEWMYINRGTVEVPNYNWERVGNTQASSYTAGNGIDITSNIISQTIATDNTIGGIKTGYVSSDEDLSAVQIVDNSEDSNYKKAFVNISNRSLKNHEVTAVNQAVYDEYSSHFDTYTVRCNISNEDLTVVNINDFKQVGNGYTTVQEIDTDDVYEWNISTAGANNTIGIIHATSTAAKGYFQLIINHGNNIVETHNVGFIIDTPANYAFAWFSTCSWAVSLYSGSGIGDNACRVYLTAPSDFEGTVQITNIHLITHSGENVGSMNDTTYKKWSLNEPFTSGSVTAIAGTIVPTPQTYGGKVTVPTGYKVPVDAFVTSASSPSVGDLLYDSEINDTLIHNLLVRVKSIELWIQNQQQ